MKAPVVQVCSRFFPQWVVLLRERERRWSRAGWYKVPQEVTEQLLEVDQPNISLSVPVNGSYPCMSLRQV